MAKSAIMNGKMLCFECGKTDEHELKEIIRRYEGEGYHFEMLVKVPFCKNCGAPIYDEEIEMEIRQKANQKIREQREIITKEEILNILESYNVSQKFLSKLLGWGEITLTRYISGNYTPNILNSNRLKALKNPYVFQKLLQDYAKQAEDTTEGRAFQKAQKGVDLEIGKLEEAHGKMFCVINWFLGQASEEAPITHLALQKLLYFVQSWGMALLGKEMFAENCQAWAHGAVYPKVYEMFRQFKYLPLPTVRRKGQFEVEELEILNAVKEYYYDVYSAKALEHICHQEEPYIKARKGCMEGEACQNVIGKESIRGYYNAVSQKYDISLGNTIKIKSYLNDILA